MGMVGPTFQQIKEYVQYIIQSLQFIGMFKSKSAKGQSNRFVINAQNGIILQKSIRLMEYINMYNLKEHQILYQCPIRKQQLNSLHFDTETDCLYEMNNVELVYQRERKKELQKIRNIQLEEIKRQQKIDEQERKKNSGIFNKIGNLFKSKSKSKIDQRNSSITKHKIDETLMKSSKYLPKSPMKKLYESEIRPSSRGKEPIPNTPFNALLDKKQENECKIGNLTDSVIITDNKQDNLSFLKANNLHSKQLFSKDQELIQDFDEDDLPTVRESVKQGKKVEDEVMPGIKQEDEYSLSARNSKVSRVMSIDFELEYEKQKQSRKSSKRSKRKDSEDIDDNTGQKEKLENDKSKGWKKKKAEQIQSVKTQKSTPLDDYIQNEISRLTQKVDEVSNFYAKEDIQERANDLVNDEKRDDSFSDIKVDWGLKIVSCEWQEKLLIDRLKGRWNSKNFSVVDKLKRLKISEISEQIYENPKYDWKFPEFNFAKVIE